MLLVTSISNPFPPLAKISKPPESASKTIALDTTSVEIILTDEPSAFISISSPDVPVAVISIPPFAATIFIESDAFS